MLEYETDKSERDRAREFLRNSRKRNEEKELEEIKKQQDEAKDRFIANFMVIGFLLIVGYKIMTGTF